MKEHSGDPKLTEALARLYAVKGIKPMSEFSGEFELAKPRKEQNIRPSGLHIEGKNPPVQEGDKQKETPQKPDFLDNIPGAKELAYDAFFSDRKHDQILSMMLLEMNEHTKEQPLKKWNDTKIALEYEEWDQYLKDAKKELKKKDLSQGERSRNKNIERVVTGVKETLLADAKDKKSIISGELLNKKREALVNANKIKDKKIQKAFISLVDKVENGEVKTEKQIREIREQWRDFDRKEELDSEARKAVDMVRAKIVFANKELFARREQEPVNMQARGPVVSQGKGPEENEPSEKVQAQEGHREQTEPAGKQYDEKENDDDEEGIVKDTADETFLDTEKLGHRKKAKEHLAVNDRATEFFKQSRKETQQLIDKENKDSFAPLNKEARKVWKTEKEHMKKLRELKEDERFQLGKSWEKYGWEDSEKELAIKILEQEGVKKEGIQAVLQGFLFHGKSGKEALLTFQEAKGDRRSNVGIAEYLTNPNITTEFLNDEEVWAAFGKANEWDERNGDRYQRETAESLQQLGWQISYILPETFGEDGDHPTWQRKVRIVDEDGRRVDEDGKFINETGKPIGGETTKKIKFKIHEVADPSNIDLFVRERINYLDYTGPTERYDFFNAVELPAKQGYSKLNLHGILAAKEKIFSGNKAESVPEDIKREIAERENISKENEKKFIKKELRENFKELAEMFEIEAYIATIDRQSDIAYVENMEGEEDLTKQMKPLLEKNHFTRDLWGGKPLWQFLTLLPGKFESLDKLDGAVGAAVIKNYLAFYYISDYEMLTRLLGEPKADGSHDVSKHKLFSLDGLRQIRDDAVEKSEEFGAQEPDSYFDFGYKFKHENGNIVDKYNNIYTRDYDGNVRDAGGRIIIQGTGKIVDNEVAKGLLGQTKDKTGKTVWFQDEDVNGAFEVVTDKNGDIVFDENGTMQHTMKDKKGFTKLINPFNSPNKNGRLVNIVRTAISEAVADKEKLNDINREYANMLAYRLTRFTGAGARNDTEFVGYDSMTRLIYEMGYRKKMLEEKKGKPGASRAGKSGNEYTIAQYKRLLMPPVLGIYTTAWHGPKGERESWKKPILEVLHDLDGVRAKMTQEGLTPEEKAKYEEEYRRTAANEMLFEQNAERHYFANHLNRAVELNNIIRGGKGINFLNYGGYAAEIGFYFKKEEFHKDVTKFITDTRYLIETYGYHQYHMPVRDLNIQTGQWENMPLYKAMFGQQMVDIPEFKTGGLIDPLKIKDNQTLLFKQFILTYFAGELRAARDINKWSSNPRYDFAQVLDIMDVLSKIPGHYVGDETKMANTKIPKFFFDKERMKWLRKVAGTTYGKLYGLEFLREAFLGTRKDEKTRFFGGVGESIALLLGTIAKV